MSKFMGFLLPTLLVYLLALFFFTNAHYSSLAFLSSLVATPHCFKFSLNINEKIIIIFLYGIALLDPLYAWWLCSFLFVYPGGLAGAGPAMNFFSNLSFYNINIFSLNNKKINILIFKFFFLVSPLCVSFYLSNKILYFILIDLIWQTCLWELFWKVTYI